MGRSLMYMPILKGREGEFRAIEQLTDALIPHLLPILEIASDGKGLLDFSLKISTSVPKDLLFAVDARHLADLAPGVGQPLRYIAEDLKCFGIPMLPVLHLDDTSEQLAVAGHAADLHCGRAVLRLGGGLTDPDDEDAEQHLHRIEDEAGLAPEQCDLLFDMFEVRSEQDLTRTEPIVRKCLSWAQRKPWRSVTVAAGAMPASMATLPRQTPTPVRRWDLALWQRIQEPGIHYGDYGIAHPQTKAGGWKPNPNLRYTHGDAWWIYRWPGGDTGSAMHELCRAVVASDQWPAEGAAFSWGDAEIARRAAGGVRPGNPTSWRAWGTSHHLAHVVEHLTQHPA